MKDDVWIYKEAPASATVKSRDRWTVTSGSLPCAMARPQPNC